MIRILLCVFAISLALCGCSRENLSQVTISQFKLQPMQTGKYLGAKNYVLCDHCVKYTKF